jgi:hypothetical protein
MVVRLKDGCGSPGDISTDCGRCAACRRGAYGAGQNIIED